MSRLKWAALGLALIAGTPVAAETSKPRNILEWIFGQNKQEQPTSITPPSRPATAAPAARAASDSKKTAKPAKADAKAEQKTAKPSIRKSKPVQRDASAIDPVKRTAAASGPYSGPFRGAGNNAYCVRTCDGFFFPINFEGAQGSDRYESSCQSSCPGAETQVYFMKRGGDIRYSSTARGAPYTSLETAFKYRKERDPACTCKEQNEKWATILAPVEAKMTHAKADIIVTEETSQRIAQGEDPAAIAKANEKLADAAGSAPQKRADLATERKSSSLRSTFGEKITPASRFTKIDPEPTGALNAGATAPAKPAQPDKSEPKAKSESGKPAASKPEANAKPLKVAALNVDKPAQAQKTSETGDKAQPPRQKPVKPAIPFVTKNAKADKKSAPESNVDRDALRQTLDRLVASNKR